MQLTWFAGHVCPRVVHVAPPSSHPRPRAGAVTAHRALLGLLAGTETPPDVAVLGRCVRSQASLGVRAVQGPWPGLGPHKSLVRGRRV